MENVKIFNKNILKSGKELASKLTTASTTVIAIINGVDPLFSAYVGHTAGTFANFLFNFADDIDKRSLSNLEKERISAELLMICGIIKNKLDSGKKIREDDFFETPQNDRSGAEEILEGVLFAAQFEHENKKLSYYANLVANIAFDPSIDRGYANFLLNIAKSLSYRQVCLLALFNMRNNPYNLSLVEKNFRANDRVDIYQDAFELYSRSLVERDDNTAISDVGYVVPGKMKLDRLGKLFWCLMGLESIPEEEIHDIAMIFDKNI